MANEPQRPPKVAGMDDGTYDLDAAIAATLEDDIDAIANQSAIEHELEKGQLLRPGESHRQRSRVLLVTDDLSMLETNSLTRSFYLSLAAKFNELHIIVVAPLTKYQGISERISDNVWIYSTGHKHWWQGALAVRHIAKEQLTFGGGFRPDLIVSINAFEGALGAYLVAQAFDRPLQVHVEKPFWTAEFVRTNEQYKWRRRIAHYVLKRVKSVRVRSEETAARLKQQFKNLTDVAVLPRYYDLESLLKVSEAEPDRDLFPQFTFVMLAIGTLDHKSTIFRAIDAARPLLVNPGVVLVIVGDGPARNEFMERAKILGVANQVIFKPATTDLHNYFASSDILIMTDTAESSEEIVIKAAASGMPLIMATTQLRSDLFEDGTDAFLCEPEDIMEFTTKLHTFLNNSALRLQFGEAAKTIAKTRLEEDPEVFKEAYAATLEQVFNVEG